MAESNNVDEVEARKQARAERLYSQAVAQQKKIAAKREEAATQGATFSPDLVSKRTYKTVDKGAKGSKARGQSLYERAVAQQRRLDEKRRAKEADTPDFKPKLVARHHAPKRSGDVYSTLYKAHKTHSDKIKAKASAPDPEATFMPKTNASKAKVKSRTSVGGVSTSLYSGDFKKKQQARELERVKRELEGCTFSPLLVSNDPKDKLKGGGPVSTAGSAEAAARPRPKARKELFERLHRDSDAAARRAAMKEAAHRKQQEELTFKPDLSLSASAPHAQFAASSRAATAGNIWHERLYEEAAKLKDRREQDAEKALARHTFRPDVGRQPARDADNTDGSDLYERLYKEGKDKQMQRKAARDRTEKEPAWDRVLRDPTVDARPAGAVEGTSERNAELYERLYQEGKARHRGPEKKPPSWEDKLRGEGPAHEAVRPATAPASAEEDASRAEHYAEFYERLYTDAVDKQPAPTAADTKAGWERGLRSDSAAAPARRSSAGPNPEFYERLYREGVHKVRTATDKEGTSAAMQSAWTGSLRGNSTVKPADKGAVSPPQPPASGVTMRGGSAVRSPVPSSPVKSPDGSGSAPPAPPAGRSRTSIGSATSRRTSPSAGSSGKHGSSNSSRTASSAPAGTAAALKAVSSAAPDEETY